MKRISHSLPESSILDRIPLNLPIFCCHSGTLKSYCADFVVVGVNCAHFVEVRGY